MEPDVPGPWRKSDNRLVRQSVVSVVVIVVIGILAFGIYSRQKTNGSTSVLGSETDHTPTPTLQALPTLPGTKPSLTPYPTITPVASPSATPDENPHGQE